MTLNKLAVAFVVGIIVSIVVDALGCPRPWDTVIAGLAAGCFFDVFER